MCQFGKVQVKDHSHDAPFNLEGLGRGKAPQLLEVSAHPLLDETVLEDVLDEGECEVLKVLGSVIGG